MTIDLQSIATLHRCRTPKNSVAPKGFEPLLTENQNLARYHYAKRLFSLLNQNVKEQFVI